MKYGVPPQVVVEGCRHRASLHYHLHYNKKQIFYNMHFIIRHTVLNRTCRVEHLRSVLGLKDGDHISQHGLGSDDALGVVGKHEGHSHTDDTLSHHDVTDGSVNILSGGETSLHHITVSILLGLGSLASELSGHNNLGTLSTRLHHETENTIARLSDGKASEKLILKGLGLGLGAKTSVGNALSEQVDGTLREVESTILRSNVSQLK